MLSVIVTGRQLVYADEVRSNLNPCAPFKRSLCCRIYNIRKSSIYIASAVDRSHKWMTPKWRSRAGLGILSRLKYDQEL